MSFQFRISQSYLSQIIREVFDAIVTRMMSEYLDEPTEELWLDNAAKFQRKFNFPNCLGAIDGKHIRIRCPSNSGSLYYNYKNYFSTVLLAIANAEYKFIAIDVGSYGREGDAGIFKKSIMGQRIISDNFKIPREDFLPGKKFKIVETSSKHSFQFFCRHWH